MSSLSYVAIESNDLFTPERAASFLEAQEKEDAHYAEKYGMHANDILSRSQVGNKVITFKIARISLGAIGDLFHYEHRNRDAMELMHGRKILHAKKSGELGVSSGLLDGLEFDD